MITPLIIKDKDCNLYGILRYPKDSKVIVVSLPAATGTRSGPQRIFVEIAQILLEKRIASLCVDLPPFGDSFDAARITFGSDYKTLLNKRYEHYLKIIINYLNKETDFKEFILLSISDGCLPVYRFAQKTGIQKLILLSPNHLLGNAKAISTKNLKTYYLKFFQKETWLKVISLNLNFRKIFRNIFLKTNNQSKVSGKEQGDQISKISDLLCIFGEKEPDIKTCLEYWQKQKMQKNIINYNFNIIKGADHSFFGWQFKKDVENSIIEWI